jgi:hypothetical protein
MWLLPQAAAPRRAAVPPTPSEWRAACRTAASRAQRGGNRPRVVTTYTSGVTVHVVGCPRDVHVTARHLARLRRVAYAPLAYVAAASCCRSTSCCRTTYAQRVVCCVSYRSFTSSTWRQSYTRNDYVHVTAQSQMRQYAAAQVAAAMRCAPVAAIMRGAPVAVVMRYAPVAVAMRCAPVAAVMPLRRVPLMSHA